SGATTITFPEPGRYRVEMIPDWSSAQPFGRINFDNGGDKDKLVDIEQWGGVEWSSLAYAYYGTSNLTDISATDTPDLVLVSHMEYAFASSGLTTAPGMGQWDVSRVKSMAGMFKGAASFNADISTWDVHKVWNMNFMFWGASSFNRDIGNWQTSSLTRIQGLFKEASDFDQDINSWDVSRVHVMYREFSDASSFDQPL